MSRNRLGGGPWPTVAVDDDGRSGEDISRVMLVAPSALSGDEYQHRNRDPLVNGRRRRALCFVDPQGSEAACQALAARVEAGDNCQLRRTRRTSRSPQHALLRRTQSPCCPLYAWDGRDARPDLWRHLAHVGGVMTARATRSSTAEAKVMGYRVREPQEVEDENDVVDSDLVHVPSTVLRDKVLQVTLVTVEAYTSMFKIDDHVPRCLFLNGHHSGGTVRDAKEIFSHETEDVTEDFTQKARTGAHVMDLVESEHPIAQTHKSLEYLPGAIQATLVVGVHSATTKPFMPLDIHIQRQLGSLIFSYGKRSLAWKVSTEDDDRRMNSTSNTPNPKRGHQPGQFIIDEFCKQAKDEGNVQKDAIRNSFRSPSKPSKPDTKRRRIELPEKMLRNHALEPGSRGPRRNTRFTDLSIEVRRDILRAAVMGFAAGPLPGEIFIQTQKGIARLRTPYAYLYDSEQQSQKWSRFPWDICTRDLRDIKAHALGMAKTSTQDLYTRSVMEHSSSRRR
ncbi:hypothetical protein FIBSPDRAFT_998540 [Athelia psychrophila]|uniref:Uncharacterized protein n=1 Tax=Athelia psychrophila TaxID=1759441 RepID=A0A167XGY9_9AGAM|nr:hypothetical protein FIBSPDRAFT_998540 [Fibularhizoctonia sp. CBS 109695]